MNSWPNVQNRNKGPGLQSGFHLKKKRKKERKFMIIKRIK